MGQSQDVVIKFSDNETRDCKPLKKYGRGWGCALIRGWALNRINTVHVGGTRSLLCRETLFDKVELYYRLTAVCESFFPGVECFLFQIFL